MENDIRCFGMARTVHGSVYEPLVSGGKVCAVVIAVKGVDINVAVANQAELSYTFVGKDYAEWVAAVESDKRRRAMTRTSSYLKGECGRNRPILRRRSGS